MGKTKGNTATILDIMADRRIRRLMAEAHKAYTGGDKELGDVITRFINKDKRIYGKHHFLWSHGNRCFELKNGRDRNFRRNRRNY